MTWIIETIKHHLYWLLAIGQPLAFFSVNLYLKFRFGQRDFRFLGGDLALCGCAVFCDSPASDFSPQAGRPSRDRYKRDFPYLFTGNMGLVPGIGQQGLLALDTGNVHRAGVFLLVRLAFVADS